MIPEFRPDGYLPVGEHQTDVVEVQLRFVDVFTSSVTRGFLYTGWRQRRQAIAAIVPLQNEWVDGSFVTAKRDPKDVDVVSFIDAADLEALSVEVRQQLDEFFANRLRSKLLYSSDSFLLAVRPVGHPRRPLYELMKNHYRDLWGRSVEGVEKGFLDVRGEP